MLRTFIQQSQLIVRYKKVQFIDCLKSSEYLMKRIATFFFFISILSAAHAQQLSFNIGAGMVKQRTRKIMPILWKAMDRK